MIRLIKRLFGLPKSGTEVVSDVRGKFVDMVRELEQAETDIHADQNDISDRIIRLQEQHMELGTTLNQSLALSAGLKKLIGV